jgi:hypothetical protein
MREMTNANILVGKAEEKRLLRRPVCRQEDNIKTYFRAAGLRDVDWINLVACSCVYSIEP